MRILFLTETVPFPLDSGGRVKTFNVLRMLAREHDVDCHSFVRRPDDLPLSHRLETLVRAATLHLVERSRTREARYAARSLLGNVPFVVERHFDTEVARVLLSRVKQASFTCVYCDHLSMIEYGRRLGLPIVYDAHNVEFEILRRHSARLAWSPIRAALEIEWRRLKAYERLALELSTLTFAVSKADAGALRALTPSVNLRVAPISVDVASMAPVVTPVDRPELLFVGGLHWPPNADAVRYFMNEIWPAVLSEVPDAHLTVVGRTDRGSAPVDAPRVEYAGYVEDVGRYFRRSRLMIVPLRSGSGMRVKILDAFGRGLPVVSTVVGCEGIEATPGVHLLVADSPREFAQAVVRILRDDQLAAALAASARKLVELRYDLTVVQDNVLEAMRALDSPARVGRPSPDV